MILITGATGHIGNVLTSMLYERGYRDLRLFVREGESYSYVADKAAEIVTGDITNPDDVKRAVVGCDKVYHLAGLVEIEGHDTERIMAVNVGGTKNVVQACLDCGVDRLLYVSSVHALHEPPQGTPLSEEFTGDLTSLRGDYAKSKALATTEVLNGVQKGLDAVIVFPSGVIGPYNYQNSHTAAAITTFMNAKKNQYYFDGAYDFVDVRDVAGGIIAAMEKGDAGQGYIMSGNRTTLENLLNVVEEQTGRKLPRKKVSTALVKMGAVLAPVYYKLLGKKPVFNKYAVEVLLSNSDIDCGKAKKKLGYNPRPLRETVKDVVWWLARKTSKQC